MKQLFLTIAAFFMMITTVSAEGASVPTSIKVSPGKALTVEQPHVLSSTFENGLLIAQFSEMKIQNFEGVEKQWSVNVKLHVTHQDGTPNTKAYMKVDLASIESDASVLPEWNNGLIYANQDTTLVYNDSFHYTNIIYTIDKGTIYGLEEGDTAELVFSVIK